ncbi:uncharacterized protein N7496_000250 [Penicillium cataractarum]|uniref:Alcohol dehydrogenase-like N-terminal domain-containing protein n=1 Tax=Penicillium cataractarum TaxID=2100454 RepID=A0A9X0B5X1_9EURO|nr:uncharacterized protein N7496_000250 [Penicillium cataractarum]KAJ5389182.1 hypothetical protein N7496_000250 [Penicillium cataractarum]
MSDTVLQYQLSGPNGHFAQVAVPRPVPGPNEVCVRTEAVVLNPLDAKKLASGVTVNSWPAVLGNNAAGVVESVGDAVRDFRPGDEEASAECKAGRKGRHISDMWGAVWLRANMQSDCWLRTLVTEVPEQTLFEVI